MSRKGKSSPISVGPAPDGHGFAACAIAAAGDALRARPDLTGKEKGRDGAPAL
jgi:hypothetical protein